MQHGSGAGPAIALTLLTCIWGYNWVVMKIALLYSAPLTFAALRSVLATVALFGVLTAMRRPLRPVRGRSMILLGVLQTTGFVGLVSLALETGAAGKSAVLAYTMPFWTLALAALLLGERIRGAQWIAVTLAVAGLVGIVSPWNAGFGTADVFWSVGAALSWAGANIVVKRMQLDGGELLNVSAWQTLVGGIGLVALALAVDGDRTIDWNLPFTAALVYNVVLATALAWMLWLFALSRLSAGAAGLASLGAPVVSLMAAWLQLGELPTAAEGIGMTLILAALTVLSVAGWLRYARTPGA